MKVLGAYDIAIKLNGDEFDISPFQYSFSIGDSLHSLYSTGMFTVTDDTGILQEYLAFIEGAKIEITYGIDTNLLKSTYMVEKDKLENVQGVSTISGDLTVPLVHEWFNSQTIKSAAYKNTVSSVVSSLARSYPFKSMDVDTTGSNATFYQPNITDAKFIQSVLVPNAYSSSFSKFPFFGYITIDNVFHFKNLGRLLSSNANMDLVYSVNTENNKSDKTVFSVKRWREGDEYRALRRRNLYNINFNDGSVNTSVESITDYTIGTKNTYPIMNDNEEITGLYNYGFVSTLSDLQKAQKLHSLKPIFFQDRVLVLTFFQPTLTSGKKVNLTVYGNIDGTVRSSITFGSDYIIENCEHIWNGPEKAGYTKLLLSRKFTGVPLNAKYKNDLLR